MRKLCGIAAVVVVCLLLSNCGGGSGGGTTPPPPLASFTIAVTPSSVTLTPGGASQSVQVSVTPQNGFSGTVSVALTGLQAGVTPTPASLSVTPGTAATLSFSAASTTSTSQQAVTLTGTSGVLSATATLQVTVSGGTGATDSFLPVGGSMTHGFYDETRQLLFACNHALNEVDVISGKDFSIHARVPVHQPFGIDQMADGKTLVIGTDAQEIVTVDEDTYAVTEHPLDEQSLKLYGLFLPNVLAMANGKVFVIGQEVGIDSDNILDGGQYLLEWNSNTNTFSQLQPPPSSNTLFEADSLARSADHKWAAFASGNFYLYSSDSDSFTNVPLSTVNPTSISGQVSGYALNADGSVIAVATGQQVSFVNRSFTILGSASIPDFPAVRTAIQFSADGTKVYLQYPFFTWIEVVDVPSYTALGSISASVNPDTDNDERMLAVSAEGYAFVGIDEGIRSVNLQQMPRPNMENEDGVVPSCPTLNNTLQLNQSSQVQLFQAYSGINLYVGGQPAPLVNGGTLLSVPASATAGPADVVCADTTYGNTIVTPDAVSYGVSAIALDGNLFPPTGNPRAYVFGYGFSEGFNANPTVTVSGQAALNVSEGDDYNFGTLDVVGFQLPNGTPGGSATITISSPLGSATLATPLKYYAAPTILPATGLLQLTYDSHRNVIYALKATEIDVLDAASLTWKSPIAFPAGATAVFNTMALSPDGSKIVVGGATTDTFPKLQYIVIDPDDVSSASVALNPGNQEMSESIAISKNNVAFIGGNPAVRLDLSTLKFTTQGDLEAGVIRASADGSHLYAMTGYGDGGALTSIDPDTFALKTNGYGIMFFADLAISPDGSSAVDIQIGQQGTGCVLGFFNSDVTYINSNVYPDLAPPDDSGAFGSTYSPSGKVLMVPLGDALELWDAAAGTLRARVMMPEELQVFVAPANAASPTVALDPTGQTVYAISASGMTVVKLPQPMDQIAAAQWPIALRATNGSRSTAPASRGLKAARITAARAKPEAALHK